MRYLKDGRPVYTATDLCDFLACGHLVTLKRRAAGGEVIGVITEQLVGAEVAHTGLTRERGEHGRRAGVRPAVHAQSSGGFVRHASSLAHAAAKATQPFPATVPPSVT